MIIETGFNKIFGGIDTMLTSLVLLMVLDFISGTMKAIKNGSLDSRVGQIGILKKVFMFMIVAVAARVDIILKEQGITVDIVRDVVVMFYIVNEIISIIENAEEMIPIPDKLKNILHQLKEKKEQK